LSDGIHGYDSTLQLESDDSSGVFADVAENRSISWAGQTVGEVDLTHLKSPGGRKEFKPGFIDSGSISANANYTLDAYNTLLAKQNARTNYNWHLVMSDPGTTTFGLTGYVSELSMDIGEGNTAALMSYSVRLTGEPTLET